MPVVFVLSGDRILRTAVRAELRERGIDALGMQSAQDAGQVIAQGITPSVVVLDAKSDAATDPAIQSLARRIPTILIASRVEKFPDFQNAVILNRPVRVADVVEAVLHILQGFAA